jgi:hypothetical protein
MTKTGTCTLPEWKDIRREGEIGYREEVQQILYNCWEEIARFAYESYNSN